ncbi:Hypothetical_protein [Hexamita inflata]|uniref:Hypothetical_protein n=1 Tax=Hexamita inflata TaxID=28002 RepID=A0AA86N723_9EUKA|nr:Hypothetical protein HINF_LOCUS1730 [Hexamita inflata]
MQCLNFKESLVNYRKHYAIRRIHLNFKKIAAQLGVTEKDVSHMFRTLQDNELDALPEDTAEAIRQRIELQWAQYSQYNKFDRVRFIKSTIECDFYLASQFQCSPRKITNKINFILKKLQDE